MFGTVLGLNNLALTLNSRLDLGVFLLDLGLDLDLTSDLLALPRDFMWT